MGANFAAVLTHEVLCIGNFENRRQLASYVGIAPTPHKSGTMDRDRRISRAGNPRARKTLIQLAWLWLRYQPRKRARRLVPRAGRGAGKDARGGSPSSQWRVSFSIALWRYVESGLVPEGAELKA